MTWKILEARPADREALVGLLAAQLAEHDIPLAQDRLRAAIDGGLAEPRNGRFLIARAGQAGDGAAVAVAYVSFIWALEHGGLSSWLEELYVVPALRGHGVGGGLLAAACALAAERGCAAIDLEVETSHTRAENLYARAGFRRHARTRWVKALRP